MSEQTYYEHYWLDGRNVDCPHIEWKKQILLSDVKVDQTDVIYDYGCGTGDIGSAFVDKCRVYGFDISTAAMEKATARGIRPDTEYQGNYKVVFILDLLEHIFDVNETLDSILSKVDANGSIYISVPNGVNLYNRLMFLLGNPIDINDKAHKYDDLWSEHIRVFNLLKLRTLCQSAGLKIVKEWYYFPLGLTEKSGLLNTLINKTVNLLKLHQHFPSLFALGFLVKCTKA